MLSSASRIGNLSCLDYGAGVLPCELLQTIYRTRTVQDAHGNNHPLAHHIDEAEASVLSQFIAGKPEVVTTLEVGCAYGLSSLCITGATHGRPGAHHTIFDPSQFTDFRGIGDANLKRAGVDWYELREERSELALPRLVAELPESFDLIFIDGWHTFDHTLVDLFFANRLIRVGGYIIVDDCNMPAVAKAVDYVSKYPAYRMAGASPLPARRGLLSYAVRSIPPTIAASVLPRNFYDRRYVRSRFHSMVALQKIAHDDRSWNWFVPF